MRRAILSAVLLFVFVGVGVASEPAQVSAGDILFDLSSGIRYDRSDLTWSAALSLAHSLAGAGSTQMGFYGTLGYFLSDRYEMEGTVLWVGGDGYSGVRLSAGVNKHFEERFFDNIFPYVGVAVSSGFADLSSEDLRCQLKVGVRQYFARNPTMGVRYWIEADASSEDLTGDVNLTAYIGIFSHPR
jgi:hypothetical protein